MKPLTVAFITSRSDPKVEWFFDSLMSHIQGMAIGETVYQLIVVDGLKNERPGPFLNVLHKHRAWHVEPKPTIWQGPSRITKEDWWAKSNALNTAICLCETEWIAFVDDRSVLMPGWLNCIYEAMANEYAVCGYYEKHFNMKVENGVIVDEGETAGVDTRLTHWNNDVPYRVKDWYGGHGALPLEWCLAVNGFSEDLCDGLGSEDSMFGCTLHNSGFPIYYDSRMRIIEDRTPGEIDGALKRADKGVSPNDKSHKIVDILRDKTSSQNSFDIRNLRARVLSGEPFPQPSASHLDWYDQQPISEMT